MDEVFEKRPWITSIKELFPYESVEINYPIEALEGSVLVEAISDMYGKVFSRTIKYEPKK